MIHLNDHKPKTDGLESVSRRLPKNNNPEKSVLTLNDNRQQSSIQKKQVEVLSTHQPGGVIIQRKENTGSITRLPQATIQRRQSIIQFGKRKAKERAAKSAKRATREGLRGGRKRQEIRSSNDRELARRTAKKTGLALKFGAYRAQNLKTKKSYEGYPEGSYAHGRWLYLSGHLKALGLPARKKELIDFDNAAVEVDHSPHDGAQRVGARVLDAASMHRVALPLPRGWHRRHKTTHGAGATRYDADFSDAQKELVSSGQYHEALENHLLDTFSDGAIGSTGHKAITAVANHAVAALNYAASNIPHKIHPGHTAGTPAITNDQRDSILETLRERMEVVRGRDDKIVNPF